MMRAIVKLPQRVSMPHNPETGVGGTANCYIGDWKDGVLWDPKPHTMRPEDKGRLGLHAFSSAVVLLLPEPEDKKAKG